MDVGYGEELGEGIAFGLLGDEGAAGGAEREDELADCEKDVAKGWGFGVEGVGPSAEQDFAGLVEEEVLGIEVGMQDAV